MNWYFYQIWLPLQLLTALGIGLAFAGVLSINWWLVAIVFFLMGPVGIGVGFHRLFSHRAFVTHKYIRYALAVLGTLSAYAPLLFWVVIHIRHHHVADTPDDPSSPTRHGFWESYLLYRMRDRVLDDYYRKTDDGQKYVLRKQFLKYSAVTVLLRDPFIAFLNRYYRSIIWGTVIVLGLISPSLLLSAFLLPSFLEHQRTNITSSLSHMKLPLSYRNYDTPDTSYNNVILGLLTFGFGWHNNHHQNWRAASNHDKWWEVDVEGMIAKLLSR